MMRADSGFQLAVRQARAYERRSGVFMEPSAQRIVENLSPKPGDWFLDLACGTGLVARHAWTKIAPSGRVVGVDVNTAMLAAAESVCGRPDIVWIEASAEALPLESDSFARAGCQQGLQFVPDPGAAVGEVHRVLRPDGQFVATVWATPGHNPYIETQLALLAEVDGSVADSARRATPANADQMLATLAERAGFTRIDITLLEHSVEVADLESFFLEQTASTPWAPVIATLSEDDRSALAVDFARRLQADRTESGHHLLRFGSHQLLARK